MTTAGWIITISIGLILFGSIVLDQYRTWRMRHQHIQRLDDKLRP